MKAFFIAELLSQAPLERKKRGNKKHKPLQGLAFLWFAGTPIRDHERNPNSLPTDLD